MCEMQKSSLVMGCISSLKIPRYYKWRYCFNAIHEKLHAAYRCRDIFNIIALISN